MSNAPIESHRSSSASGCVEGYSAHYLRPLFEVNETALGLLGDCARTPATSALATLDLVESLRTTWLATDGAALRRAAQCPALLVDFDRMLTDTHHTQAETPAFWCPPIKAMRLTRSALTITWYLCRTNPQTASIRLGLPLATIKGMQGLQLTQIDILAETKSHLLRPRWPHRHDFWKKLLVAAQLDCPQSLNEAKLQALHLLVSELAT